MKNLKLPKDCEMRLLIGLTGVFLIAALVLFALGQPQSGFNSSIMALMCLQFAQNRIFWVTTHAVTLIGKVLEEVMKEKR